MQEVVQRSETNWGIHARHVLEPAEFWRNGQGQWTREEHTTRRSYRHDRVTQHNQVQQQYREMVGEALTLLEGTPVPRAEGYKPVQISKETWRAIQRAWKTGVRPPAQQRPGEDMPGLLRDSQQIPGVVDIWVDQLRGTGGWWMPAKVRGVTAQQGMKVTYADGGTAEVTCASHHIRQYQQ